MLRMDLTLALFVLTALLTGSAKAADDDTTADVRCIVAASVSISATTNQELQDAFRSSIIYYLGRIDGRDRNSDIESKVIAELEHMTRQEIGSEDIRCGKLFSERGDLLLKIARDANGKK
jgi:hypothetical protein